MLCGNCGTEVQTSTCQSTGWSAWSGGTCTGQNLGTIVDRTCGECGAITKTCGSNGNWVYSSCTGNGGTTGCENCGTKTCQSNGYYGSCTGQGVCSPSEKQSRTCAGGTTQTITCTSGCKWPDYPACPTCDGFNPGQTQTSGCGNCGSRSRTCQSNGQWNSWSGCSGEGVCSSGSTRGCGNCGTETCTSSCQWSGSCAGQGPCSPSSTDTSGCTSCKSRTCQNNCQWGSCSSSGSCTAGQTQCTDGNRYQTCPVCTWVNSGTNADGDARDRQCGDLLCDNAAGVYDSTKTATETACTDGLDNDCDGKSDCADTDCNGVGSCCSTVGQTQSQGCGNCGSQTRTCQSNNQWGAFGTCTGEGVCVSGQTQTQSCGNCGSQTRTCQSNCQWPSAWGICTGQGPCSPGSTDSLGCTACKTRTCQNTCQWGPCSGSGSCTAGQTQCTSSDRWQTCPSCTWVDTGTNADNDAKDKECGDSLCDNAANIYDSTKTASETLTTCKDTLDNDCDGKVDCVDPDCTGIAGCCTTISRDCKLMTERQFKDMFWKCYKLGDSKECDRIQDRIQDGNFYACPPSASDSSCCTNPSSCVFSGVCHPDGEKMRLAGDSLDMKCVARSPGQWVPDFETDCTNSADDDFDGSTDCNDSDCDGKLNGTVKSQSGVVPFADISINKDLSTIKTAAASQRGDYSTGINCGTYTLVSSHPDYAPQAKQNILVFGRQSVTTDFSMVLGTSCEQDCTFAADNIVHAACDGKNGCSFCDSIAKGICDLSQPGWVRDYDADNYIVCASGCPKKKVEIEASVTCTKGTLVKVTRIVTYNGKPVKMIVAACG